MKLTLLFSAITLFCISCKKTGTTNNTVTRDITCQQYVDANGNAMNNVGNCTANTDSSYSAQELALFSSMDTADLSNTQLPVGVVSTVAYPNPFLASSGFRINFGFNNVGSGQLIAKFVLTDANLQPLFKRSLRLVYNAPYSAFPVSLLPTVSAGLCRMYYTLSAAGHPHFLRAWVNLTAQ